MVRRSNHYKRVLVRGTNWVGDSVMALPALREVRRMFPQAALTLMVRPPLAGLFLETGLFDEVIEDQSQSLGGAFDALKKLRSRKFEIAVLFPNSFQPALLMYLAGIPVRCGYQTQSRGVLLTRPIKLESELTRRHQVFYYLHLVSSLEQALSGTSGVDFDQPDIRLTVSDLRKSQALEFLHQSGADTRKQLAIINPGATNSRAKCWLPERFAAVGDQLLRRGDVQVALIGSRAESGLAQQITQMMRHQPVVLTGQTDLGLLVAIISLARLLITNDTGPAHIGAAVGVPTLVIFGPTEHYATRPFSPVAEVVRQPVVCSPCMLRECPIDHRCMTQITTEEVMARATRILDSRAAAAIAV